MWLFCVHWECARNLSSGMPFEVLSSPQLIYFHYMPIFITHKFLMTYNYFIVFSNKLFLYFMSLLVILWEFCIMHFDLINPSPISSQVHSTALHTQVCAIFSFFKPNTSDLCYQNALRCLAFHWVQMTYYRQQWHRFHSSDTEFGQNGE